MARQSGIRDGSCSGDWQKFNTFIPMKRLIKEFEPSDELAWQMISDFKESRAATNKSFANMKVAEALWLIEASANEANADLSSSGDYVESVKSNNVFSLTGELQDGAYFASGNDIGNVYAAFDNEMSGLLAAAKAKYGAANVAIVAIDLDLVTSPPSPLPSSFLFKFTGTVLLRVTAATALFTCDFGVNDDWQWWNQGNTTANGNCTLTNGPGLDATIKIEGAIAKCTPASACTFFTNVSVLQKNPLGEGVAPNDPTSANDNLYDYKIFINASTKPNYHTCLSDLEMDFYRDWTLVLGTTYLPVGRELIRHDLRGDLTHPLGTDLALHNLDLWYGKCSISSGK
jgi:hypothetical protein